MSICGLQGHAYTDPTAPESPGTCDRCGWKWMHSDLSWQFQYAGNGLVNLRILVCPRCLDTPASFLQAIILPPDPIPIKDPRPGFYQTEETQGQLIDNEPTASPIIYDFNGVPIYDFNGQLILAG